MKKIKNLKMLKLGVLIFALVGVILLGYFYHQKPKKELEINRLTTGPITYVNTGDWLTFESKAPFVFQYPTSWGLEAAASDGEKEGIHLQGPEGDIYLNWGKGFGGACDEKMLTTVKLKNETLSACQEVKNEGKEAWWLISKQLSPEVSFDARADVKTPIEKNRAMILTILSTVSFTNPQ